MPFPPLPIRFRSFFEIQTHPLSAFELDLSVDICCVHSFCHRQRNEQIHEAQTGSPWISKVRLKEKVWNCDDQLSKKDSTVPKRVTPHRQCQMTVHNTHKAFGRSTTESLDSVNFNESNGNLRRPNSYAAPDIRLRFQHSISLYRSDHLLQSFKCHFTRSGERTSATSAVLSRFEQIH
jgi:hypothetical protein